MADLIKKIKIKKQDGTFTDYIPIGAEAQNISTSDGDSVQLKLNKKPYYYNTVADMKADIKLKAGDMAVTFGYYEPNDGGRAEYRILSSSENYYETLNNNLKAELIVINNTIDIKQLGAKGDGITDDTAIINEALANFKNILITNGIYMVDPVVHINPTDNNKIEMVNATLKAIGVENGNYAIVKIYHVSNVTILGGTIQGERDSHTGSTGEWGMGIGIYASNNILIKNVNIKDCWGDGIYIYSGNNIYSENNIIDNVRRNGISIINVNGFWSQNDYIKNTNGTAPQAGVDLEPNHYTECIKNCCFDNLTTYNNAGAGFDIQIGADENTDYYSIYLNNYHDIGSNTGISISKGALTKGNIDINKPLLEKSNYCGVLLRECDYSDLMVNIDTPTILNCNTKEATSAIWGSGISLASDSSNSQDLGNVYIYNPYISFMNNTDDHRSKYIFAGYPGGTPSQIIRKFAIYNPRNHQGNLAVYNCPNFIFTDINKQFVLDQNYSWTLSNDFMVSEVTNSNFTSARTYTLSPSMSVGREFTFRKTGNYNFNIQIPADQKLYRLLDENGNTITTSAPLIKLISKGQAITIKKADDTTYYVINNVGDVRGVDTTVNS